MSLGIIARRPEQVHTDLVDLAHYIIVFHSDGHRTTNLLNDIHEGLGDAAIELGEYEYLVYKKGSGEIIKEQPIKIEGFTARKDAQVINACVPLSEMFGYATILRSMTQGRAIYSMQFEHYSEVPKSIAEEITEKSLGKKSTATA